MGGRLGTVSSCFHGNYRGLLYCWLILGIFVCLVHSHQEDPDYQSALRGESTICAEIPADCSIGIIVDKYILKLGQILFAIRTNTVCAEISAGSQLIRADCSIGISSQVGRPLQSCTSFYCIEPSYCSVFSHRPSHSAQCTVAYRGFNSNAQHSNAHKR